MKEFTRKDGLAVEKYYRETFNRVGEVRSNRQTIPFVGSLFTRDNVRKLTEAYGYGLRNYGSPSMLLWLVPKIKFWGATRAFPELVRNMLFRMEQGLETKSATSVGLVSGWADAHQKRAFDQVANSESPQFPSTLEIMLVPGVVMAASVHAPIGSKSGLPVPLGYISFDPRVIERASEYLETALHRYIKDEKTLKRIGSEFAKVAEASVGEEMKSKSASEETPS